MIRFFAKRTVLRSFLAVILLPLSSYGQRSVIPASATLTDRYPKRLGHLRSSGFLFDIGKVFNNETRSDTLWFFNEWEYPMNVRVVGPANDPFRLPADVSLSPVERVLSPGKEGFLIVTVDGRKSERLGFQLDNFRLLTDDSVSRIKNLSVASYIAEFFPPLTSADSAVLPKVSVPNRKIDFGKTVKGKTVKVDFYVRNDGRGNLSVRNAYSGSRDLRFEFSKQLIPPSDSARMTVEFDTRERKPGPSLHRISVFVNDPAEPEIRLELSGKVE
ncbi:MAG: hypothetical protein RL213_67 [Bacteroidota bacterium]|jgi:hypothetical protein